MSNFPQCEAKRQLERIIAKLSSKEYTQYWDGLRGLQLLPCHLYKVKSQLSILVSDAFYFTIDGLCLIAFLLWNIQLEMTGFHRFSDAS